MICAEQTAPPFTAIRDRRRRWRSTLLATIACLWWSGAALPAAGPMLAGFIDDLGQPLPARPAEPLTLLVFGYTSCPDICPLTLLAVHQALEQLGTRASGVTAYFVTVDPERDSMNKLHQYVASFDPRIRGLRGPDTALHDLTSRLGVRYWRESLYPDSADYAMSHTATLFLLDAHQRLLTRIRHQDQADALAGAIVRAIRKAPRR